ncbi:MAG TPA: DEAD/DEAH box helicase [Kofleriaceae bacterium]|nr:DEAD/DEAH box helicase [Kofleriaceae bacterium]
MMDDIGPAAHPAETDADQEAIASDSDARTFASMNLAPEIQQALGEMGYLTPMDVQVAVFQQVMDGHDIMVQSRTGTGKTAAFGIPIAQRIAAESKGAQVLILAPTRELALQVSEELKRITRFKGVAVVPIYGGAPMKPQIDALQAGAQIVAGTPGRVLDHIRRKTLSTRDIRLLVLDECDEMLSMGFQEEIENILSYLPPREERQTMLFSATIPEAIERIARRHMRDPAKISLSADGIGVREISHYYYMVSGLARTRDLLKVLKAERPESAIIFCNTREDTSTVAKYLVRHGYDAEAISSDLTQRDRERVMKRSRDKTLQFLVATDIAARGIDISDLTHVINFQFPESPEVYVHRTGRTGRAGKTGVAVSLVGPREIGAFYYLKLIYKIRPEERELPSAEELLTMQEGEQYERVVQLVPEAPSQQYLSLARRVWQSVEGERVVGALLQRLLSGRTEAAERPARRTESHTRTEPLAVVQGAGGEAGGSEAGGSEAGGEAASGGDDEPRKRRRRRREIDGGGGGRDRDRDRGGRGRDRDRGRERVSGSRPAVRGDRDRDRDRGRSRDAAPAEGGEKREPAGQPLVPMPGRGPEDGREFWEAWADEKSMRGGPAGEAAETADITDPSAELPVGDELGDDVENGTLTARLYVNIGKREEATADDIRELLSRDLGDDASRIGSVALRNTHAYVRVPEDLVDRVIEATRGKSYKERELLVERARR